MRVLCISGSRADYGGINAVHSAFIKKNIEADLWDIGNCKGLPAPMKTYDIAVILGDRSEILNMAAALYLEGLPIAHLSGGDLTEGSKDDSMRHAITKLSHLHFPTNEDSARRIIQMGEEPWRVKVVGYPGVDDLTVGEISEDLPSRDFLLVVWHPNTLVSEDEALEEAKVLTSALEKMNKINKIIIGPNNDPGGYQIAKYLENWADENHEYYEDGLSRPQYLALLKNTSCLVGNSSSGFYEAPSFGTPVVNIGDRQKGRIVPSIMVNSDVDVDDIVEAIHIALVNPTMHYLPEKNVYEKGNAAEKISQIISEIKEPKGLLIKKFHQVKY